MKTLAATIRRKIVIGRRFANVRGVLFFAQRRVQRANTRGRLARTVAFFLPPAGLAATHPMDEAGQLKTEGFVPIEGVVTPVMAEEMRAYLSKQPVYPPYIVGAPLVSIEDEHLPDSHTLVVPESEVVACPHLLDVANHPKILAAVEGVLGCKPTIGFISAWWSVPTADHKPRQAENFHRDFDDLNFIKLFIYLTNVEADNGPHEFIRGSHSMQLLHEIRRYDDDEVFSAFGRDRLVNFVGPAGTVFLENTYGLHRGQPVQAGKRLILQVVYSMLPMSYGPAAPYRPDRFAPAQVAVDPYVNRVYLRRE